MAVSIVRKNVKQLIHFLLSRLGLRLVRIPATIERSGLNLNVGSGGYVIHGFVNLDYFSEHYYGSDLWFKDRVHYDMRNDALPYTDNSVDNIYCSHVIEHIETPHVERFFRESQRVLKPGGCLRIACPDSDFLYRMMLADGGYFKNLPLYQTPQGNIKCFLDVIAAHEFERMGDTIDIDVRNSPYIELMQRLRENGVFDPAKSSRHINNWDFSRIAELGNRMGFKGIYNSKCQGSISPMLQGTDMDLTHPEISLYVDLVK